MGVWKIDLKKLLGNMFCETQNSLSYIKRIQDFLIIYIVGC